MSGPRAHVSLTSNGKRVAVLASSLPEAQRPAQWQWLSAWLGDNWMPIDMTGNGALNDFALVLEQRSGALMRLAAFVTVKEKNDGTIKIKARTDDVSQLPDKWDSGLAVWTQAGWDLIQVSGSRDRGFGWLLVKNADDGSAS